MSIEVKNLSFSYGKKQALEDISFCAQYGEFVSVLGPNGAGKSTLFRCMLALEKTEGMVLAGGQDVCRLKPGQLAKRIAYIPQHHSPAFSYSVADMVLMGAAAGGGMFSAPDKKHLQTAEAAMEKLGISQLKNRSYNSLSGGQRQLLLVARAIAQQAKILIMDEPAASLDFGNRIKVMKTVRQLADEGYCVIQSTHDPERAYLYSDRVLAIQSGRLLADGSPDDVICGSVISALYGMDIEVRRTEGGRIYLPAVKTDSAQHKGEKL